MNSRFARCSWRVPLHALAGFLCVAMRTVWTDEHATFHGEYHSFDDWNVKPKCIQQPHVPIWVGGASKGALERAIAVGDVWHPLGFVVISDEFMKWKPVNPMS